MTLDEISKLSDDELRVKVAELVGWEYDEDLPSLYPYYAFRRGRLEAEPVPDFPGDLNAMAEAEGTLDDEEAEAYWNHLVHTVPCSNGKRRSWVYEATARQRAIAFIATKEGVR